MKKALIGLLFLFASIGVNAQSSINIPFDTLVQLCPPDTSWLYLFGDTLNSSSYTVDSIPYSPESIGGTNVTTWDDQVVGPFNIGFPFTFYCNTYTQFYICSNGWIGFTGGQTATWVVQTFPSTATNRPKNVIAGPWRDWNPAVSGGPYITYQTVGTAPCRKLIVTWNAVPMYSCTTTYGTFQIVLNETSNIVENHMTNVPTCLGWGNGDGTQGTHNLAGNLATVVASRNESNFVCSNESWQFTPSSPIQWNYPNGSSAGTGNCIPVSPSLPTWIYANAFNCNGDTLEDSVYIDISCIFLEMDSMDVECTGDSSGYAIAEDTSISTGTSPPYNFVWVDHYGDTIATNPSNNNIDTLFNLPSGGYTCFAYDNTGQIAVGYTYINEPDSLPAFSSSLEVECTGDQTGVVWAEDTNNYSGTSFNGLYNFYWSDTSGTVFDSTLLTTNSVDSASGVGAGTYFVTVDGCYVQTGQIEVSEPDTVTAFTGMIPVLCNGDQTGTVFAEDTNNYAGISSFDGFYSYYWTNSAGNGIDSSNNTLSPYDTVYNLGVGTYNVTIDGCYIQLGQVTVTEPAILIANISDPSKISCPGVNSCDASAVGNGTGGVLPYSFQWTSGEATQQATALCSDTNWLTVTDFNGCIDTDWVFIEIPDSIITTGFGDTLICITNPAAIIAASTGGTPPFSYVWREGAFNGPVISTNALHTVFPHKTTRYYVESTDSNNCEGDTASVLIKVRPELGVELPDVDTICPYDIIDITVQGTGGDSNYTYTWSTGEFGATITVSPDEPVWYHLTVSDACGTPVYLDSIWVQVGGYSPIDANIRVEDDSICVGENVYLIGSGRGGFRGPEEYIFKWSETNMDGNSIQFVRPTKTTTYLITITDLCLSPAGYDTLKVHVGTPDVPKMTANPEESCSDGIVIFSIPEFKAGYTYNWNVGDSTVYFNVQDDTVNHIYKGPGCYDVKLTVITDFGCFGQRLEKCLVHVLEAPIADFVNVPINPNTMDPIVKFVDESWNAQSLLWQIDGDTVSNGSSFFYEFIDTGLYEVSLIAISPDGCIDTLDKTLHHTVETTLYVPKSFSPNEDGLNDVFKVQGESIELGTFELIIFDRWGTQLFYTKNPDHGWDGRYSTTGEKVPQGAYPYVIRYRDKMNEIRKIRGQVIVSKSGTETGLR